MPKTKISEFSATAGNNTDIDGINIAEGCAPSGINDAIRELMAQLKDFQAGTAGDSFNGPVGTTTAAAGAFTTLSASSTVSGTGFSNYLASPPTIGGTTPNTGSFTTLTTSSTVTHNGGTANGVAYLNGSKVLTTGSGLTYNGGGQFTLNAGAANSTIAASSTSNTAQLESRQDISYSRITSSNFLLDLATLSNQPILFTVNNSEQMRLTSTGLGIGTSSPTSRLTIGTGTFSTAAVGTAGLYATLSQGLVVLADGLFVGTRAGADRLILDSSGNLGLGVTPSASWSGQSAFQVNTRSAFAGSSNFTAVATNAIATSNGWAANYLATGTAALYTQSVSTGAHAWYTAPSGTAGNAISFTQAMTLDASGQLMVGKTSNSYGDASTRTFEISGSSSSIVALQYGGANGYYLQVNSTAGYLWNSANTPIVFGTNNTERARITSGGYFKASNTGTYDGSTAAYHELRQNDGANQVVLVSNTSASVTSGVGGVQILYPNAAPNGTGATFLYCADSGALRASIRSNGGIANYQANDVNLSDQRLKTDIQPSGSYLDKICAIPVKTFLYKDQTDTERNLGVMAQDVDAVAPELIDHSGFGEAPEGGSPYLAVYQTDLQYALMKCIQELKAQNDDLRARVAQLEAK